MSDIDFRSLIDGTADEMHLDVRDLAADLRGIAEDGDTAEIDQHFNAAKSFLSELGIPVETIDEAADAIQEISNTGSPTLVVEGFEEEWGEDEWTNLGLDEMIRDSGYKETIKDSIDFEKFGRNMLESDRRTKAAYGRTYLWVLHG